MDVIFLLGVSQAFFLAFLVFKKDQKSHGDYVLALWLAFLGLHLLDYYIISTNLGMKYPHLLGIGVCFPMLQGPFMFVYIKVMISKSGKIKLIYWLHSLPFILLTLYLFFDFYLLGAEEKLAYYKYLEVNSSVALFIISLLNNFLGPIYVIWSLVILRKHIKNISNDFSYTDDIDLKWLKYVLAGLGVVWMMVILTNIIDLVFIEWINSDDLIYLAVTIAVFFLGYYGIKQKAIYLETSQPITNLENTESFEVQESGQYKKSGLKKENAELIKQDLLNYMNLDQPYLNSKLSLKNVADDLNISVNHLSQVMNEQLGKSFFDFVNGYRVEEVKRLLKESRHEQFTLLALAYDSGFNSKSSFNHVFKRITNSTPSEYIKTISS